MSLVDEVSLCPTSHIAFRLWFWILHFFFFFPWPSLIMVDGTVVVLVLIKMRWNFLMDLLRRHELSDRAGISGSIPQTLPYFLKALPKVVTLRRQAEFGNNNKTKRNVRKRKDEKKISLSVNVSIYQLLSLYLWIFAYILSKIYLSWSDLSIDLHTKLESIK